MYGCVCVCVCGRYILYVIELLLKGKFRWSIRATLEVLQGQEQVFGILGCGGEHQCCRQIAHQPLQPEGEGQPSAFPYMLR